MTSHIGLIRSRQSCVLWLRTYVTRSSSQSSNSPPLTPPEAAATVARDSAVLLQETTHGRSIRLPSLAYAAATPSPSHCRWSPRELVTAGASSYVAKRSYGRRGTTPADAAS